MPIDMHLCIIARIKMYIYSRQNVLCIKMKIVILADGIYQPSFFSVELRVNTEITRFVYVNYTKTQCDIELKRPTRRNL